MKINGRFRKFFLFTPVFFLLLWGGYKSFFYFDRKSEEKAVNNHKNITRLTQDEIELLQEGDFILRRGFGFFSDFVAKRLNDSDIDVTHAGILVRHKNQWHVIHALSSDVTPIDGMQMQTLKSFLKYSQPDKIIVTRTKNATPETCRDITRKAQHYLNRKIPFDHHGDYENDDKLYCTELIWRILEKDLELLSLPKEEKVRKKLFHTMNGLYDEQYFDIVINQYPEITKTLN